jgi:hypothetical protein
MLFIICYDVFVSNLLSVEVFTLRGKVALAKKKAWALFRIGTACRLTESAHGICIA